MLLDKTDLEDRERQRTYRGATNAPGWMLAS
jgi:hypothetical protein